MPGIGMITSGTYCKRWGFTLVMICCVALTPHSVHAGFFSEALCKVGTFFGVSCISDGAAIDLTASVIAADPIVIEQSAPLVTPLKQEPQPQETIRAEIPYSPYLLAQAPKITSTLSSPSSTLESLFPISPVANPALVYDQQLSEKIARMIAAALTVKGLYAGATGEYMTKDLQNVLRIARANNDNTRKSISESVSEVRNEGVFNTPTLNNPIINGATFTDTLFSGETLTISGTSTLETLVTNGVAEFGEYLSLSQITAPSDTTDKLYNVGGDLYWSGTLLNNSVSTTTDTWDTDNTNIYRLTGNVGIGTSTLGARLHVQANGTEDILNLFDADAAEILTVTESGAIGLLSASPGGTLPNTAAGTAGWFEVRSGGTTVDSGVLIRRSDGATGLDLWNDSSIGDVYIDNRFNNDAGDIVFRTKTSGTALTPMRITGAGLVGIGATPSTALHVRSASGVAEIIRADQSGSSVQFGVNRETVPTPHIGVGAVSNNALSLLTNNTSRVYIDTSGYVGIGTNTPATRLAISESFNGASGIIVQNTLGTGSAESRLSLLNNSTDYFTFGLRNSSHSSGGRQAVFDRSSNRDYLFQIGGSDIFTLYRDGNVGVGSTTPFAKLSVTNTGSGNSLFIQDQADDPTPFVIGASGLVGIGNASPSSKLTITQTGTENSFLIEDETSDATPFVIDNSGNVGIGVATPARRLHISGTDTFMRADRENANFGPAWLMTRTVSGVVANSWVFGPSNIGGASSDDFAIVDYGTAISGTSGNTRLVVSKSSGNVGVASTTPGAKLTVQNTGSGNSFVVEDQANDTTAFVIDDGGVVTTGGQLTATGAIVGNSSIRTTGSGDDLWLGSNTQTNANFQAYANGELRIDADNQMIYLGEDQDASLQYDGTNLLINPQVAGSGNTIFVGGNVGIGSTTAAAFKLQVEGNVGPDADNTYTLGGIGSDWECVYYEGGSVGTCASDERLKENITDLTFTQGSTTALEKLTGLQLHSFAFKDAPDSIYHGLIAQEVLEIAPELVVETKNDTYAVKYGDIQWLIVEAFQELWRRVQALFENDAKQDDRIAELEAQVQQLQDSLTIKQEASAENSEPEVEEENEGENNESAAEQQVSEEQSESATSTEISTSETDEETTEEEMPVADSSETPAPEETPEPDEPSNEPEEKQNNDSDSEAEDTEDESGDEVELEPEEESGEDDETSPVPSESSAESNENNTPPDSETEETEN